MAEQYHVKMGMKAGTWNISCI